MTPNDPLRSSGRVIEPPPALRIARRGNISPLSRSGILNSSLDRMVQLSPQESGLSSPIRSINPSHGGETKSTRSADGARSGDARAHYRRNRRSRFRVRRRRDEPRRHHGGERSEQIAAVSLLRGQ